MRRILLVLTMAAVIAVMMSITAPAFAANPGFGTCSKNYSLVAVAENNTQADEEADRNANGFVCERTKSNGTTQYKDDR